MKCSRFCQNERCDPASFSLEKKYDEQFKVVFDAIRALMAGPEKSKRKIGFHVEEKRSTYRVKKKVGGINN
jgi:hypothetical protein